MAIINCEEDNQSEQENKDRREEILLPQESACAILNQLCNEIHLCMHLIGSLGFMRVNSVFIQTGKLSITVDIAVFASNLDGDNRVDLVKSENDR